MSLITSKTKDYQDCMKEMQKELKSKEKEHLEHQQKLKEKEKELELLEKQIKTVEHQQSKAESALTKANENFETLRKERQKTLLCGSEHKKISQQIKESRENLELSEDTVIAYNNELERLTNEKQTVIELMETLNSQFKETSYYCEVLKAAIEYNEAAEKLAPACKKVADLICKQPKESAFRVYEEHNSQFSNVWLAARFETLYKLYVGEVLPDKRDEGNRLLIENLWHYNKKYH